MKSEGLRKFARTFVDLELREAVLRYLFMMVHFFDEKCRAEPLLVEARCTTGQGKRHPV